MVELEQTLGPDLVTAAIDSEDAVAGTLKARERCDDDDEREPNPKTREGTEEPSR